MARPGRSYPSRPIIKRAVSPPPPPPATGGTPVMQSGTLTSGTLRSRIILPYEAKP